MATCMGIIGHPNTGKSFSRTYIKDASDCFVISSSKKFAYLLKNDVALPAFDIKNGEPRWKDLVAADPTFKNRHDVIRTLAASPALPPSFQLMGNSTFVNDLEYIISYLQFIDKHMPHIKNVFLTDFTHWISTIIGSDKFRSRTSGGQAFERLTLSYDI